RLARVVRLPVDRPRLEGSRAVRMVRVDAIAPVRVAGRNEGLGNVPLVEVLPGREDGRGTEAADDREQVVLLYELLRLTVGLGRVVLVVAHDVLDLAAMDTAFGIDIGVVRLLGG